MPLRAQLNSSRHHTKLAVRQLGGLIGIYMSSSLPNSYLLLREARLFTCEVVACIRAGYQSSGEGKYVCASPVGSVVLKAGVHIRGIIKS